ncbi:hypothetical protein PIB30_064632 [Stylosanthes scabra]|uniref:Uncharacterized protein n=1 Tax=Stylosanthes scabra TaxID=79078 RepID=A0ABU6VLI8_9FABA|nr:hypothetical protein [Stylosanthes scabra]
MPSATASPSHVAVPPSPAPPPRPLMILPHNLLISSLFSVSPSSSSICHSASTSTLFVEKHCSSSIDTSSSSVAHQEAVFPSSSPRQATTLLLLLHHSTYLCALPVRLQKSSRASAS